MKKLLALVLALAMVLSLAACGGKQEPTTAAPTEAPTTAAPATEAPTTPAPTTPEPTTEAPTTEAPTTEPTTEAPTEAPGPQVLTYQEFVDAPVDSEVIITGTVQLMTYNAKEKTANLFLADEDGAYYVYGMTINKKDVTAIEEGVVLQVKGFKSAWAGEVEITEAEYEILEEDAFLAEALDVTDKAPSEMEEFMNRRTAFTGGYVVASITEDGAFVPFLYKWNGSGEEGDDIYFKAAFGGNTYTFVVESDEFGKDSDLYQAVQELQIDQLLDLEAFLYWYEGPQPHVCAVNASPAGEKPEGVMTFDEYLAAEIDSEVTVEGYIQQAAFNAENGNVNLFLADADGAYFVFRMNFEEEDAPELLDGCKIRITGFKTEWNGEIEISDGKFTPLEGTWMSDPLNITKLINKEELSELMNRRIVLKTAVVVPTKDADDNELPFLYKYNGSGEDGDDLYFTVNVSGEDHVMVVESDEHPAGSDVYEAVKALEIGDALDLEGFLYWYEGPQPHIYAVTEAEKPMSMTYAEFLEAEEDSEVAVEGFIQLMTYDAEAGTANMFLAAADNLLTNHGAYYVYAMPMTEEEAEDLQQYDCILVRGFKKSWSGEIEITDATFEKLEGSMMSSTLMADELFALGEGLEDLMNARIGLSNVVVIPSHDADGNDVPFLYKWNGSGEEGDDIYFNVLAGGREYTMVVESTEFGPDSSEYQAAQALQIGDVISLEAFLYWYEGPQPHVCYIAAAFEKSSEDVSSFGRYYLAETDAEVTVEGYIRLFSSYWEEDGQGFVNVYLDDNYGGYYIYKLPVKEEDLEAFNDEGVLLQVKGFKGEWSGMTEVIDASEWKILEHEAGPGMDPVMVDLTELLQMEDTSTLSYYIARHVGIEEVIVMPSQNEDGEELPFLYKWNGAGEEGDDIYFNVKLGDKILTVTVESTEFGPDTDVYQAAQRLQVGDVIDLFGFLYWYEGPQPHISGIEQKPWYPKQGGAMSYYDYLNAETDAPVTVDGYVQLCALYEKDGQSYANLFLHDRVGAYYVYGLKLEEEDREAFANIFGSRLVIKGYRGEWSGEIEVVDVESYDIVTDESDSFHVDKYIASPVDVTDKLGDEEALQALMNAAVTLCGAEVIASEAADGSEQPFLYKWNGSGEPGDDIYLKVKAGDTEMSFVVETDEFGKDTVLYKAVEALQIGDKIDLLAYMYWYEGPQPHLCELRPAEEPAD